MKTDLRRIHLNGWAPTFCPARGLLSCLADGVGHPFLSTGFSRLLVVVATYEWVSAKRLLDGLNSPKPGSKSQRLVAVLRVLADPVACPECFSRSYSCVLGR